jgi:hypothetical protein
MMWNAFKQTLGVVVISGAIAENTWLVLYVSTAAMAVQHSTNCLDRPLDELAAVLVYLATGTSVVAAVWFYERVGHKVADFWDRLLWRGWRWRSFPQLRCSSAFAASSLVLSDGSSALFWLAPSLTLCLSECYRETPVMIA